MNYGLGGKIAVISGGTSGIGLAAAKMISGRTQQRKGNFRARDSGRGAGGCKLCPGRYQHGCRLSGGGGKSAAGGRKG